MGFALVLAGPVAWFSRGNATDGIAAVVGGLVIIGASYWYLRPKQLPDSLEVDSDEVRLSWEGRESGINLDFRDPRVRFGLKDSSGMPGPKDLSKRRPNFYLMPINQPQVPIPKESFDRILDLAGRSGLNIQRDVIGGGRLGTAVIWWVSSGGR